MTTLTVVPNTTPAADDFDELAQRMALVACGVREGKTRACDEHQRKGMAILRIASTGALDALALTICGAERPCTTCTAKAAEIIRIYNEAAR
ncbi:hypothetical protein ACPCAG_30900 [Streptomyces pseudogriseolus]|uniref:hypothetical protein n=1 Tax=Streptomyces pseudogriseolus TaxID=36817 RepID=UPI003FA203BE